MSRAYQGRVLDCPRSAFRGVLSALAFYALIGALLVITVWLPGALR